MQIRGLLAALVLLAVLGGGVWYSNKRKAEEEKQGSKDTPKILSVPEDQLTQIDIQRADGKSTTLKKTDKWQITAPQPLQADQDAVTPMVSAAASLLADSVVEEKAGDVSSFGFNTPQLVLKLTKKDGKSVTLKIADEMATGSGFYAMIDGDPRLYTISSVNKTSFDKTAQDLRDKRLLAFDADKLTRVELTAKGSSFEFGKNAQSEWQIVKPKPMRADNWGVEELVRKIKEAKMDSAVSEEDAKKADANFASGTKIAVAKVSDAAGTHEIEIRKKENDYFAKGSAMAGAHKVTNELGEGLDKGLNDFRNRKLFDFGFSDPTKVEVKAVDGQTKTYSKSGEKWMRGSETMDSVGVQSFIDKLRDLAAVEFKESGFGTPVLDLRVTSKDGKLVDHVQISKGPGADAFAVRVNEPTVYQISAAALLELEATAAAIKPPAPPDTKKKDEKKK
ncbi:MAG: DUF4340 domain-containing protein [Bryobacterales bacterium]|nr:DUF4340 domain-containing protein [Bryobacterales bacterium]